MLNVLVLPHCKHGAFGGIQTVVEELTAAARNSPQCGVSYVLPDVAWFEGALASACDGEAAAAHYGSAVRDLLAGGAFHLVHSHNLHIKKLIPFARVVEDAAHDAGIPHVMSAYDVWPSAQGRSLAALSRTVLLTSSRYTQAQIHELSGRRAEVVPIGIDFSRFPVDTEPEPRTIAYPGRIAAKKGTLDAIRTAGLIAAHSGPVKVLLSDWRARPAEQTDEFLAELARAIAHTPAIEVEYLRDPGVIPGIYRRAVLTLAMPRWPEGFGLTPLESLACGCPVVAVPNGGMTEWIGGLPGTVALDGGGAQQAACAANEVIENWPRFREGALQARELLKARFDARVSLEAHAGIYGRVLNGELRPGN